MVRISIEFTPFEEKVIQKAIACGLGKSKKDIIEQAAYSLNREFNLIKE